MKEEQLIEQDTISEYEDALVKCVQSLTPFE